MNVLDLFSGIGGFALGLERAGPFRTVAFCESEPYPRAVLARRWPGVPCYDDACSLTAQGLAADGVVRPDVVTGGFPCQDISSAGRGKGIDGARSGLWREMARLVDEIRPRWVVAENSPALRGRGGDRVLSDLEALGYACWPVVVGAVHAGAWHRRQRVWIVAYAGQGGQRTGEQHLCLWQSDAEGVCERLAADPDCVREHEPALPGQDQRLWPADGSSRVAAHPCLPRQEYPRESGARCWGKPRGLVPRACRAEHDREAVPAQPDLVRVVHGLPAWVDDPAGMDQAPIAWPLDEEPPIARTARDVPNRVQRIAALGNAVVPEVVAMIGRSILAVESRL